MACNFFRICILLVCCLLVSIAWAAEDGKGLVGKGKVTITAKMLTADNKEKTALFEGSVHAKRGEIHLQADRMKIYYAEEDAGSSIKKIEAQGNVRLIKDKAILTSQSAVYLMEPEEKIIFLGDPRAAEGSNIVTGTKMTYYIKEDRSVVEDSKVFIVTGEQKSLRLQ